MHAFSDHKHEVCVSKVETHVHEKDTDCELHLIRISSSILTLETFDNEIVIPNYTHKFITYNFLKNHYQLPFSLRGPPSFI